MTSEDRNLNGPLEQFAVALDRSHALDALVYATWQPQEIGDGANVEAPAALCCLSLDHGRGLRTLLPQVPPAAIALLRPQYEALVRAVWARYAATENDLGRLLAPLTSETQQAAKKLPGVPDMLAAIKKSGPRGASILLIRARAQLWDGLNSFIHGGIHPFRRGQEGYPLRLLTDVLKNANAMSMMTLLVLAEIAQDQEVLAVASRLNQEFHDVLPTLEPLTV